MTRFTNPPLPGRAIAWLGMLTATLLPTVTHAQEADPAPTPFSVQGKEIALVFDDGPIPGQTNKILDALLAAGMRASFSVVASRVEENPTLAKRIVSEGHELVNQTYSKTDAKNATPTDFINDVMLGQRVIERVTGAKPRYFRAPNNILPPDIRAYLEGQGFLILEPTLDSGDWRNPSAAKLKRTIMTGVTPGAIILAHDSFPNSVAAMPAIIADLAGSGYQSLTISELQTAATAQESIPSGFSPPPPVPNPQ
jgi:peptidoglycan/xylan/chitin deacetylase (PgdA/CDA1 family)